MTIQKILFSAIGVFLLASNFARAESFDLSCISEARDWYYTNTSDSSEEALKHAEEYCSYGAAVSCLAEAKDWFYTNTSDSTEEAVRHAEELCIQGGSLSCLAETKDWYYTNTSDSTEQAVEHAKRVLLLRSFIILFGRSERLVLYQYQ